MLHGSICKMKKAMLMKRLLINKQVYKAIKYQIAKTVEKINCKNEHTLLRTSIVIYKFWLWVLKMHSVHRLA